MAPRAAAPARPAPPPESGLLGARAAQLRKLGAHATHILRPALAVGAHEQRLELRHRLGAAARLEQGLRAELIERDRRAHTRRADAFERGQRLARRRLEADREQPRRRALACLLVR